VEITARDGVIQCTKIMLTPSYNGGVASRNVRCLNKHNYLCLEFSNAGQRSYLRFIYLIDKLGRTVHQVGFVCTIVHGYTVENT